MRSKSLYIELARHDIARFRFLLEAYDNLAIFSILDRFRAVGRVFFSPSQEEHVRQALIEIASSVHFQILAE